VQKYGTDYFKFQHALLVDFNISKAGAYLLLAGQPMAYRWDRQLLRMMLERLVHDRTGGWNPIRYTLLEFGITLNGSYEIVYEQVLTDQADRDALPMMVLALWKDPHAQGPASSTAKQRWLDSLDRTPGPPGP
jgi:hypothetical protein